MPASPDLATGMETHELPPTTCYGRKHLHATSKPSYIAVFPSTHLCKTSAEITVAISER